MASYPVDDINDPVTESTELSDPPQHEQVILSCSDYRLRLRKNLRARQSARQNSPASNLGMERNVEEEADTSNCAEPALRHTPFPLLSLPAELRVHIYRMALCRSTPLFLHVARGKKKTPSNSTHSSDSEDVPELRKSAVQSGRQRYTWDGHGRARTGTSDDADAISPALLRVCTQIYREARPVLYADNKFIMHIDSGVHTLSSLHQRSRSLIKDVTLTIPSHHDILDGFADLVRLGLRYCWGLKRCRIVLPGQFPDERFMAGTTSVYANAFHILRWLPKGCVVELEGSVNELIRRVVEDEGRLMCELDEKSYLRRQHQMPEKWRFQ